jgi:hypothetical protein
MRKNPIPTLMCAALTLALLPYQYGAAEKAAPPADSLDSAEEYSADTGLTPHTLIRLIPEDSLFGEEETEDAGQGDSAKEGLAADTVAIDSGAARPHSAADSAQAAMPADSLGRAAVPERPAWLYPGLSQEQDQRAHQVLHFFHLFDWNNADKTAKKLQKLEKKNRLPPLSYLLAVGMRVSRVQNGEYEHDKEKKELLHEIQKLSEKGLELADPEKSPDSCRAINLFISGGIKGFVASLEIDRNPINAALNGFAAKKLLERALARDSTIKDAYLGLGLFSCMLAKAPLIVRGALTMIGKEVTLDKGLGYLRAGASEGCYTNDIARLYLVQFLSPYLGHEAQEKKRILRSLQQNYPGNPYYVFLEIEENLCFHPGALTSFSFRNRTKRQIAGFSRGGYSLRRYANLVKWQYLLVDPIPLEGTAPDTTFNLRGFSYYPVFLQAIGERLAYQRDGGAGRADQARRLRYIKARGTAAARMLDATPDMPSTRKSQFLWHIRDALSVE